MKTLELSNREVEVTSIALNMAIAQCNSDAFYHGAHKDTAKVKAAKEVKKELQEILRRLSGSSRPLVTRFIRQ